MESIISIYRKASRGDGALRYAGEKEAVIIFGTIWIVDELIKHNLITTDEAKKITL